LVIKPLKSIKKILQHHFSILHFFISRQAFTCLE
jgi:hypothetical protein